MKVVRGKGGDHHRGEQEHDQDRDGWGERGRTELGGKEGWPKGDEIYDLDLCPRAIRLRRLGDDRGRRSGVGLTLAVTRRLRKLLGPRSPTNPSHNVPSCLEPLLLLLLLLLLPASPSRPPHGRKQGLISSRAHQQLRRRSHLCPLPRFTNHRNVCPAPLPVQVPGSRLEASTLHARRLHPLLRRHPLRLCPL